MDVNIFMKVIIFRRYGVIRARRCNVTCTVLRNKCLCVDAARNLFRWQLVGYHCEWRHCKVLHVCSSVT